MWKTLWSSCKPTPLCLVLGWLSLCHRQAIMVRGVPMKRPAALAVADSEEPAMFCFSTLSLLLLFVLLDDVPLCKKSLIVVLAYGLFKGFWLMFLDRKCSNSPLNCWWLINPVLAIKESTCLQKKCICWLFVCVSDCLRAIGVLFVELE